MRCFQTHQEVHTPATSEHRLLPGTKVGLCFLHGEAWRQGDGDLVRVPPLYVDHARAPGRVVALGSTRIVGVELHLWGAIRLFGPRFEEDIAARVVEPAIATRIALLLEHEEVEEALDVVARFVARRALDVDLEPTPAMRVAAHLCDSRGEGNIAALAGAVNLSVRQLERQFRDQIGMSPKRLARLIRFENACDAIWRSPERSLTALTYDLGYADQAHFSREFRAFAGITPRELSAETKRRSSSPS